MRSPPEAREDRIVVSEMGEHWSPRTAPPSTAPKQTATYDGSGTTAQASGMASGNTTAYVPQDVPIENATTMQISMKIAGSSTGWMMWLVVSTMYCAVPSEPDTRPRVTARPRMMAPIVTPLQPSTKPSIASFSDMPLNSATAKPVSTARPNASAI